MVVKGITGFIGINRVVWGLAGFYKRSAGLYRLLRVVTGVYRT